MPLAKKTTPAAAPEPVETPPPAAEEEEQSPVMQLDGLLSELHEQVRAVERGLRDTRTRLKAINKVYNKAIGKKKARRPRAEGSVPSGFARPCLISDTLATFIGAESGARVARTDVTKSLNQYVVSKNLKNPDNGREVFIDDALSGLTGLKQGEKVNLFGIQAYLKQHYIADPSPAAA